MKELARSALDIGNFIGEFFLKPDNWFYVYAGIGGLWIYIARKFNLKLRITFRPDLKDKKIKQLETEKASLQGMLDLTRDQYHDNKRRLECENENMVELLRNYKVPETLIRRARGTGPLDPSRLNPQTDSGNSTTRKENEPNKINES